MPRVEVEGRTIEVAVRRSRRARTTRIVVDDERNVEVVLPLRAPARLVGQVLDEHRAWLARQLARPAPRFCLGLARPDAVWLHGYAYAIPEARSLELWYREQAREVVEQAVAREAERLNVAYGRIAIRDQRTRWASCSARGNLSFNWRLVVAPEPVLDYVVVHELCHRLRHDHSPEFWSIVAAARPTYARERRWLHEHGPELLAYRPPSLGSARAAGAAARSSEAGAEGSR